MIELTILDTGFVSGELHKPLGYAGDVNSRCIHFIYPEFDNCKYELFCKKGDYVYKMDIDEYGVCKIPPSLTRFKDKLEFQFVASRMDKPEDLPEDDPELDGCWDDFVFKSAIFCLKIADSLAIMDVEPVPTYEAVESKYQDLEKMKAEIEQEISDCIKYIEDFKAQYPIEPEEPPIEGGEI